MSARSASIRALSSSSIPRQLEGLPAPRPLFLRRLRRVRGALSHVGDLLGLQEHLTGRCSSCTGARKSTTVSPNRNTSPSRSGSLLGNALAIQVRPVAGLVVGQRPLFGTQQMGVPARDTSLSHDSTMSLSGRRPMVIGDGSSSSVTRCCFPAPSWKATSALLAARPESGRRAARRPATDRRSRPERSPA